MATMDAETIDLNALLSYSLNINFAPLQAHLRASSVQAKEVQGQVAELRAQNDLLRGMLASASGGGGGEGGAPLGEVLELRAALAALAARIDALPPPQFFTWDAEREAMAAAERLAVEASGQALEAKGAALDAAGEATAAGEDARKAAAVAAAAAMEMRGSKPAPLNLSRIEERLLALETAAGASAAGAAQALAAATAQSLEEAKQARSEAAAALAAAAAADAAAKAAEAAAKAAEAAAKAAAAAAAAAQARLDSLEFSVTQLKTQVATLNSQMEMLLAAPPPPPPIDPNASLEAQALSGLQAELAALRAQLAHALKQQAEGASSLGALEAALRALQAAAAQPAGGAGDAAALEALGGRLGGLEAGMAKLGEGSQALAGRVAGCETTQAGQSKELREIKGALDIAMTDIAGLAARPVGGGGGGPAVNEPAMLAWGGAVVHLLSILCGGKADGASGATGATGPAGPTGPKSQWPVLEERCKELLSGARPSASAFDLRTLGAAVGALEKAVKEAGATASSLGERVDGLGASLAGLAPRVPAHGALALLAGEDARLAEGKADKAEVEAALESTRGALGGLAGRLAELGKALAALGLRVDAGGGGGGVDGVQAAAATGRQLLRDLYCLSCSRPAPPQGTDRGPYSPTGVLEPHTQVSARFLHGMAAGGRGGEEEEGEHKLDSQQQQHFAAGGAPPPHAPVAYNPNLANLSASGAFQVLPNGVVLGKLGLRAAAGRSSSGLDPNASLETYVRVAGALDSSGVVTQGPNRLGGMSTHRPLPPMQHSPAGSSSSSSSSSRTASDQGLPSRSVPRGGGVAVGSGGAVTTYASPTVDPVTQAVVPHFFLDPEVQEERDRAAVATMRATQRAAAATAAAASGEAAAGEGSEA